MTTLTEHFTLDALLRSSDAITEGFTEQFSPPQEVISNLQTLSTKVLEPLRILANEPVFISSGYRFARLNAFVGGEPDSQHLTGKAADTTCENMDALSWYNFIKKASIPFDQLIIEHDRYGHIWVHVSFDADKVVQRGECMRGELQDLGGTVCTLDEVINFAAPSATGPGPGPLTPGGGTNTNT